MKPGWRLLLIVLLPCLLLVWANRADASIALPVYGDLPIGAAFAAAGTALILLRHLGVQLIYVGIASITLGASMYFRSAAGLWLITPTISLACGALVYVYHPIQLLPPDDLNRPRIRDGIRFVLVAVIPWLLVFGFTSHMHLPGTAFGLPFEDRLPVLPWTAVVYETSYLTVTFAPTWTRTNRQLRQLMISVWVAVALVFPIYWLMPSAAPRRPMVDNSWIAHLLLQEREVPPSAAFPSFHVLWAIFVGRLWGPWLGAAYTVLIAISCISTGMHYIPDALASILLAPLLLEPEKRLWIPLKRLVHNSRGWLLTAVAACVQFAIVVVVAGPGREWKAAVTMIVGLAAALVSPFAFPISLTAAGLTSLLFEDRWILIEAYCLSAPWMHVLKPGSRRELLLNLLLGLVLWRLWSSGSPASLVCGVYLIGHGLARFIEETLPFYRAIAVTAIAAGAIVTAL